MSLLNDKQDRGAFFRRLRLFGMGVVIGCVCVYFMLIRGKDLGFWTPGKRVLEKIHKSELVYTKKAECLMECLQVSKSEVESLFVSTGEVDFGKSQVHQKCPLYIVNQKNSDLEVSITTCDSVASVTEVKRTGNKSECSNCKTL
jgi:hypothetical protein